MEKKKFSSIVSKLTPSRPTAILLNVCLTQVLASLLVLVSDFANDILRFPSYALAVYPDMFEYIMMATALTFGGALILEYSVREKGEMK